MGYANTKAKPSKYDGEQSGIKGYINRARNIE